MTTPRTGRFSALFTPRRALAGVVVASLATTGVLLGISSASAAPIVIGDGVVVAPAVGTNATLFSITVPNAACPAGTVFTQFALNGPGIVSDDTQPGGYGIGQNTGNATGIGLQQSVGLSIANIATVNSGSFIASGTYVFSFQCWDENFTGPIFEYQTTLAYTAGAGGAYTTTPVVVTTAPPTTTTTVPTTTTTTVPTTTTTTVPTTTTTTVPTTTTTTVPTTTTTTVPTTTTTTTAPTEVGGELLVSKRKSRARAVELDGAKLKGRVYIFATKPAGRTITSVQFLLDDKLFKTERYAPYDFAGGQVRAANPFNVSTRLRSGHHTVSVVFKTTTGDVTNEATFTVARSPRNIV